MEANLLKSAQNIATCDGESRYHVVALPELPHKLGISADGFPMFFVMVSDHDRLIRNLNAELLSVEYNVLCNIVEEEGVFDNQRFTIITLRSENEQLQKMFVDVFLMMLITIPKTPSNIEIATKVESLLSIFSKLKRKPIHKLQGLWAELFMIEQSNNPTTIAGAWHSQIGSKYDFTMGEDKIEVKSTSSEERVHRFSLDQLNPSENSRLLICSVVVRESAKSANGISVYDLYNKIAEKIHDTETKIHVYEVMTETLGSDFNSARKKHFDYIEACDRLAFYDHHDVPKIDKSVIPEHVSEVKFSANLSHLVDIRIKGFDCGNSSLFNALF